MPLSLAFRFVAGRYHATPFGHHVNEGMIEWPPSPWRLLRSLVSVGYTSGLWDVAGVSVAAGGLIDKLSAELPRYRLPRATGTHSRHYMPIGRLDPKKKIEKTTLVFDSWARVDDEELIVHWENVVLDKDQISLLNDLVQRLNYLGRSESWVEGRVMQWDEATSEFNCFPEVTSELPDRNWEQIALLAAINTFDYDAWRKTRTRDALSELPLPSGRKVTKALLRKREKAVEPYPLDLLDCLQKDTNWHRSYGWSQPPGSRRVFYWRQSDVLSVTVPIARKPIRPDPVKAMLLSITNSSRNDHALPPVTRTLPQADLLHRQLVGIAANGGAPPSELTGRDEHGQPLRGAHEHAHINPLDLDGDGHLDHILVWAPSGLSARAQAAIRAARKTYAKDSVEPLRIALAGMGDLYDLTGLSGQFGQRISQITGDASSWQSVTPFVPGRYIKKRGKNTLEGQIRAELHSRGLPPPDAVQQLAPQPVKRVSADYRGGVASGAVAATFRRFRHFVLSRQRGPEPPIAFGFAVRLKFNRPVSGPIAIGYGSHFGLGLFESCSPGR